MADDPKVSKLHLVERESTDADEVFRDAMQAGLTTLVIIGSTEGGDFHFDSVATNHEALWLLKMAERHLFDSEDE